MLYASIDIGSNAVRLLFSNAFNRDGYIYVEKATIIRIPVRLGMDVFKNKMISETREKALTKTLKAFKLLMEVYKPVEYRACATSAMREAENGQDIIKRIKAKTGIKIKIIDGIEEADIIRSMSRFDLFGDKDIWMFIDVGGGSTEISLVANNELMDIKSFKIGTIRLLEEKVHESEWNKMVEWLNKFRSEFDKIGVIGSGGNINKIAKIYGEPMGKMISVDGLEEAYKHLTSFSVEDRIEKLGLRSDRADVIVPAAKIFLRILNAIEAEKIIVPKIGLADGLIYKMFEEDFKKKKKRK